MRQNTVKQASKAATRKPKNRLEVHEIGPMLSGDELHQKIQDTAYMLFVQREYCHGNDVGDWLQAEKIVKGQD